MTTNKWQRTLTSGLQTFFLLASAGAFAAFLFAFFGLPTQSVLNFFKSRNLELEGYCTVACVMFAGASGISFLLYQILKEMNGRTQEPEAAPTTLALVTRSSRALEISKLGISLILMGAAVYQLNSPIDIDEAGLWSTFPTHDLFEAMNPNEAPADNITGIPDKHHSISILASYVSYRIFGMHKSALRFPSLFFAAGFLILIALVSRRYLTPFQTTLLYLNLGCNQMAQWYFHSSRGYISMMFLTLIPWVEVWNFTQNPKSCPPPSLFPKWLFITAVLLAPFSHTFGGGFLLILAISLVVWLYFNRLELSTPRLIQGGWLCASLLMVLPVVGIIFLHHGQVLNHYHYVFGKRAELWSILSGVMGANRHWWGKLTFLLLGALVGYQLLIRKNFHRDFLSQFVCLYILFFGTLVWAMEVTYLNPRFFLAFLVPFIIWLGRAIEQMRSPLPRQLAAVLALVLLVAAPSIQGGEVYRSIIGYEIEFNTFVSEVLARTRPNEVNCYSISGDSREATWAQNIFFRKFPKDDGYSDCRLRYHLGFLDTPPTDPNLGVIIFSDHKGRYLLQKPSRSQLASR